jgi:hypothetical protein
VVRLSEEHIRLEIEFLLADVLALADELTELFVPSTEGFAPKPSTDQLAALGAQEAGLFGHLRSVREAIATGRIQDVIALQRTIKEIRKKAALCASDQDFARRVVANESFKMKDIDDRYEALLASSGEPRTAAQRERDRGLTDKMSWLIHARHRGLQFQVLEMPNGGALITRTPRAAELPDRGRVEALRALITVWETVRDVVPPLLEAIGIPRAEWDRREREFAERIADVGAIYLVRDALRRRNSGATFEVNAQGFIERDGKVLATVDQAAIDEGLSVAKRIRQEEQE